MRPLAWFPEDLRSLAEDTIRGKHITDAPAVFSKLRVYGDALIRKKLGQAFFLTYFPSSRSGGRWPKGQPTGVMDHFTAATAVDGTLVWFSNKPRENSSSSHFVIDRNGDIYTIIDPLTTIAWHSRPVNSTHVGIEIVNAGKLLRMNGRFYFMGTCLYPRDRYSLACTRDDGTIWELYTTPQLISNIVIKRWLIDAFPAMKREKFVDHHQIEPERKNDCGPLWPLRAVNDMAFSWRDLSQEPWFTTVILSVDVLKDLEEC